MPDFSLFSRHGIIVSRETEEKFNIYNGLILKWQKTINLVAPSTLDDLVSRHFLDSAQIFPLVAGRSVIDLGSGAGFPGMVLAMLGVNVQLVESDQRKAVFLREVSRETKTPVIVHSCRIEALKDIKADVVTARALAPLKELIAHMQHLKIPRGVFLKGENIDAEVLDAKKAFDFDCKTSDSLTDKRGKIVIINSRFT